MRIPLPYGGLHNGSTRADQPLGTSSDLMNRLPFDARTGRAAIAQRPGHSKYSSTVIGGSKVKAIAPVPAPADRLSYTSLGNSVTTEWSAATPSIGDSKGVRKDRQGNAYFIDGKAAIIKVNPAGVVVSKLALPVADPLHEIRAIHIDRFDRLYVGVSTGGSQTTARIWCYKQDDDENFKLVWQMEPGEYVEAIVTANDSLYYAGNKLDSNSSRIVGMTGFDVDSPTTRTLRACPYPINDLALSPKDGSLFVASEPNATRGFNPLSPDTSAISVDWTPLNLTSYQKRIWSWHDAKNIDDLLIIPPTGSDDPDGGQVTIWYDKSGNNRHWYAGTNTATVHTGPIYRKAGIAGQPSLHFNGSSNSMYSLDPISNDKASRAEILSTIPTYPGAQFVWVGLVRIPYASAAHYVLSVEGTSARAIVANAHPGAAIAGTASDGSVRLFETGGVASTPAAADTPNATAPAGSGTTPLAGCIGPGGLCILTWVCDGGVHDVFGSATRSSWWVNGLPCDRWQSAAFTATMGARLGFSTSGALAPFGGDIVESICLSDWYDTADVRQRLVLDTAATQPLDTRYPDAAFSFSSTVTNDLAKLIGYIAHANGCAHLLPGGQAAWLINDAAAGNFAVGETVTIDATTYTMRAVLAAANDVLIGGTGEASLRNLRHAINGTGTPGTSYYYSTVPHTTFRALGPIAYQSTNRTAMLVRSINPNSAAATVGDTAGQFQWSANTVGVVLTASSFPSGAVATSKNTNWYPHQYFPQKLASQTLGGPPRSEDALTAQSKPGLFVTSPYGILAKIDPANSKVKWIATSDYDNAGTGIGGVGYGVVIGATGEVYSIGPRQALVTSPAISADAFDVRRFADTGTAFTTTWAAAPGAITYQWPRMDVDKFTNVYVPIFQGSAGTSLIVYPPGSSTPLATVTNITDDPRAYAVAVHPTIPDYPQSFTDDRAQFVYLATEKTASNIATYKLGLVSVVNTTGTFRNTTRLAVVGADIKTFTAGGTVTTVGSSVLDAAAQLVATAVGYRKVFFFDGRKPYYYDAVLGTVSAFVADGGGEVMADARFATFWRGRLFIASQSKWAASEVGNPLGWNLFPAVPNDAMAVSNTTALAGQPPDSIQSLHAINDDLILIGGMNSIRAMAGDPARPNTKIQLITNKVGTSIGPCWAQDDSGVSYFFGSDANVYEYSGGAINPITLGDSNIHEALRAIDFSAYYAQLVFDTRWQILHVLILPFGPGGVNVTTHYMWHKPSRGWFPASFAAAGTQFTCATALEADTAADRLILLGCEDGYVRKQDPTMRTDDGLRMETRCLVGPIAPETSDREFMCRALQAVLDAESDGCYYQTFVSDIPNLPTIPVLTGTLRPGFNNVPARMCGPYLWVRFQSLSVAVGANVGTRDAIESLHMEVTKTGIRRSNAPVR